MVCKVLDPGFQLCLPIGKSPGLILQLLDVVELALQLIALNFRLREQTGAVEATLVFQILQLLAQLVAGAAFVAGY